MTVIVQTMAVATEAFFADRKGRGNKEAAIRFLSRAGGKPPQP